MYLAAVKDRLYCDDPDSIRRRRTQTVIYEVVHHLIRMIAPILVHTAEEAWLALKSTDMESDESVHLRSLPEVVVWEEDSGWAQVMGFRQQALKALEEAKAVEDGIRNPLDAGIRATVPSGLLERLRPFREELADLCGVSRLQLEDGSEPAIEVLDLRSELRCERSWKRDGTVQLRSDGGLLSDRDAAVLGV